MRQVPPLAPAPFGIVGDGRVARHFSHYFTLLGLQALTWSRRSSTGPPVEALAGCGTVLLLIRDAAIVPFLEAWPELRSHRLVHCAGSLVVPGVACAHPLMTFGPRLYDRETYRSIPFVLDADSCPFEELLPGLPNASCTIPADERAYYHALCVMAGNFTALLWRHLFAQFEDRLRIPAAAAHPFLAQTAANLAADPSQALTGPLVRGDAATIAANLDALDGDAFQDVYAAFVRVYAHRA